MSNAINQLQIVLALAGHEWRRFRRSSVWMIGLGCAVLLAWNESDASPVLGYPTSNQSLYAFQLASSMVLGLVTFLLAAGSVAADLEGAQRALLFSRPVSKPVYLSGKFLGVVSFALLAVVLPLCLFSLGTPLWHGVWRFQEWRPFLLVIGLCVLPMLCYVCALGMLLMAWLRKVIVGLPLFLIYFFSAALLSGSAGAGAVKYADFSLRLYPRELVVQVPLTLREYTFAGILDPVSSALIARSGLYLALAVVLFLLASRALGCNSEARMGAFAARWRQWWQARAARSSGEQEPARPDAAKDSVQPFAAEQGRGDLALGETAPAQVKLLRGLSGQPGERAGTVPAGSASLPCLRASYFGLADELRLLRYSAQVLIGRNLLAMALIAVGLIVTVLTYPVGAYQTHEGIVLFQLEMFAPLLGVVMFSDLVASEFEARRADWLRLSRRGAGWLIRRRLAHAVVFTLLSVGPVLLLLRVSYTRFNVLQALGLVLPGTLFFGTLALLAASATRRSLVGYAVGSGAMLLWLVMKQVEPLTPVSYFARARLANAQLLGEWNWLLAKLVFVVLALGLGVAVLRLVVRPAAWRAPVFGSLLLVVGTHAALHWLWQEPQGRAALAQGQTHELIVREAAGGRNSRRAVVTYSGRGRGALGSTSLSDARLVPKAGRWEVEREVPVDLTRELEVRHLDLEVSVVPARAELQGRADFQARFLSSATDRLLFYLAPELQITQLHINGQAVQCNRYGDLVEAKCHLEGADPCRVEVAYAGRLQLPQNLKFERASKDLLFVNSRWFPSLHRPGPGPKNLFTCRATVRVPQGYRVAAAAPLREEAGQNVFLWESRVPTESIPLCVGRFRGYEARYRDIPLTFCTFSADAACARRILERSCEVLRCYEQAYGPYPYSQVAIVENPFQGAGGQGFASLVTIKPERLAPEHEPRLLEGYLPHELAHLWWGNTLPPWVAEANAVFANYHFLEQSQGRQAATAFLDREIYAPSLSAESRPAPLPEAQGPAMYARGGYLLLMLQSQMGPARLLEALRTFVQQQAAETRADGPAQSEAFIKCLQEAAGPELNSFIEDWVRSVKRFDPAVVALRQQPAGEQFAVTVELQQCGEVIFPVAIRLQLVTGQTQEVVAKCPGQKEQVTVQTPVRVASVTLDPEHRLLDCNRANNQVSADAPAPSNPVAAAPQFAGWKTYTSSEGLPGMDVRCLLGSADRSVLAGTWSLQAMMQRQWAVASFTDGRWQPYESRAEPIQMVTCLAQPADRSLWLASQNQLRWMRQDDVQDFFVNEICLGGTVGKRRVCPHPKANAGIPGSRIYALLVDRQQRLWLGTDQGATLFEPQKRTTRHFGMQAGLGEVFALAQDATGQLWAGTDRGLCRFREGRWQAQPESPRDLVLALAVGAAGQIWGGTYRSGLVAVQGATLRTYSRLNAPLPDTIFSCLACDQRGRLWAGTPDGLLHYNGQQWRHFTRANSGLPSNQVHCLASDEAGHIWIGTDAGVTRYAPEEQAM